jgi:hypothetical protein
MYIVPDADGRPIQVMSGASIDDTRFALQGRARNYRETGNQSLIAGFSKERDYLSLSAGGDAEWELDSRRTTVSAGALYSRDHLDPNGFGDPRFPNRIEKANKNTVTAFAGVSQVLTTETIAQFSLNYSFADGFLSDPYKEAYVAGNVVADARPGRRNEVALNGKLREYFPSLHGALHLDGRWFRDDWGISADTIEVAWYQNLPADWKVAPSVRWYEQGHASFYRPYYTVARDDGHYSSDYRLSAFGALSYRLATMKSWAKWDFSLAVEYYNSAAGLALHKVDQANPGLVDFAVITSSISRRF